MYARFRVGCGRVDGFLDSCFRRDDRGGGMIVLGAGVAFLVGGDMPGLRCAVLEMTDGCVYARFWEDVGASVPCGGC